MAELEIVAAAEDTPSSGDVSFRAAQSGDTYMAQKDLSMKENNLTDVGRVVVSGTTADYTATPGAFVDNQDDHTWDYAGGPSNFGRYIEAAYYFGGEHRIKGGNANPFVMGYLFNNEATIKNESGEANSFAHFVTTNASCDFIADGQTITQGAQYDHFVQTLFGAENSGSLTTTTWSAFTVRGEIGPGATVTRRLCYTAEEPSAVGGTLTGNVGFTSSVANGTNNADYMAGYGLGDALPTGDWVFYQGNGNTRSTRWNGGQQYKITTSAATSLTLNKTHHIVAFSSTSTVTVTLPAASAGAQEYIIKKTGASGTININRAGSDTIDGGTTVALSTQYHLLRIVSNGSNAWHILHNGAP